MDDSPRKNLSKNSKRKSAAQKTKSKESQEVGLNRQQHTETDYAAQKQAGGMPDSIKNDVIVPKADKNRWGKQLLAIVFATVLLWLAFRGTDFNQIIGYSKQINLAFLVLVFLSGLISHILRAWRWIFLLEPVALRQISLWNSFSAVIMGYAVNIVIPRGGEVARVVSISRSEKLPWAGVLPTMLIDRLLDIALLVLLLGTTLTVLPKSMFKTMPWLLPGGMMLTVGTVIGLFMLPFISPILNRIISFPQLKAFLRADLLSRLNSLSGEFHIGTKSLCNPKGAPMIIGLSLAIWFFYWLSFYLLVLAFGLSHEITPVKCLIVFTIGSIGVLIPTPGSVGSFHFLVSQALILTVGLNKELALAFATVGHLVSFISVSVIPALFCLALKPHISRR